MSCLTNITALNYGLGNSNQKLFLDIKYDGNPGSAFISSFPTNNEITIRKLDSIDEIKNFNIIKMDVEGYEHQVLLGAEKKITECRPQIILEYFNGFQGESKLANKNLLDWLSSLNYTLYIMDGKLKTVDQNFLSGTTRLLNILALPTPHIS